MQSKCSTFIIKLVAILYLTGSGYSKIVLIIKPSSNKHPSVITAVGVDDKKVTEKEINMFNFTENNLKRGIRIEMGKIPNDVFIRDPTPYHNLFAKYNWTEVHRRVQVKKAEVFEIVNQNIRLATHSVINNTTAKIRKLIGARETVENTISSSWRNQGTPEDEIFYNINVTYDKQSFVFNNKQRFNNFESFSLSFGIPPVGYIFLESGQTAYIELSALKTILLLKIDYSASLVGNVIANYAQVYGKYHFWAPSVASIMKAAKLKNEFITTEYIEVRSYFDPRIKVFDKFTLEPIEVKKLIPFHPKKVKIN